jgi:molybdate transport system substrate-binding protein
VNGTAQSYGHRSTHAKRVYTWLLSVKKSLFSWCCIGKSSRQVVLRTLPALLLALALCGVAGGCGSAGESELTVLAASSLQDPLTAYGASFDGAEVRSSFAGSDTLAAQIRQGAAADVFASADTDYPAELRRMGLVEQPVVFAANELVIAVPAGSDISSLADLAEPGRTIVIGDPSVPVGSYTREVLRRLPAAESESILANVRSEEPEVSSIVAKLGNGAADAGFVYVTDVRAAAGGLRMIRIPETLRPKVTYAAAVVKGTGQQRLAQRYLDELRKGRGAIDLRRAGFLPPP